MHSSPGQNEMPADRRVSSRLSFIIATGAGAGLIPGAPGTYGSIEGAGIYLGFCVLARRFELAASDFVLLAALDVAVYVVGVLVSKRVCEMLGSKDPGQVVVDEISGQLVTLTPMLFSPSVAGTILGFVLFRFFDITKPLGIARLERLPGGWGVMTDDLAAGVLAGLLVWAGRMLQFF